MHVGIFIVFVIIALIIIIYYIYGVDNKINNLEELEEAIQRKKRKIIKSITSGGIRGFLLGILRDGSLIDGFLLSMTLSVINPIMILFE